MSPKPKESDELTIEELSKQVKELTAKVDALKQDGVKKKKSDKPRAPSKYAIFIKDNYAMMKNDNPNASMGEISKLLAKKWKETQNKDN